MPDALNNTCRALLPDGRTRCTAPLRFSTLSCAEHAPAYDASYKQYKEAERKADGLREFARMPPANIQHLRMHEIGLCQARVRVCADALAEELRLRKRHIIQFIGTPDAGHRHRLAKLEREIASHRHVLRALRTRRRRLRGIRTHTPRRGIGSPARAVSRIGSPTPRPVRRRIGPPPEEERRARARAQARLQREEEQQRQHSVVVEAERQRQTVADEAYNRQLKTALLSSRLEQYEKEALRATEEGDMSQDALEVRELEGCTQGKWIEEAAADTADGRLAEYPPEEWPREVRVPDAASDTASDSTSNASSDGLQSPVQQLPELPDVSVHVDDDWRLPNSMSSTVYIDEETESLQLIIGNERVVGSEDSSVTTLDPQSAQSPKPTCTDNEHDSQPASENVGSEIAIGVRAADDSCAQVLLADIPSDAASNQGSGDAVEGRKSGSNEGRPRGWGWGAGRINQYLQCPAFAAIIVLLFLRKRYRVEGLSKLWKLFRQVARAGAWRISN